jgi:hypothetical protein
MSVYADGHDAINQMIHRARLRRHDHRAAGGSDDEFIGGLIEEFTAEAKRHSPGAGSAHMALSVYWLARLTDKVLELQDAISMRNDALRTAWARIDADEALRDA